MRLIIEARLVDGESDPLEEGDGVLAVIERPDRSVAELGLTLTEGRSLLAKVQTELISKKVQRCSHLIWPERTTAAASPCNRTEAGSPFKTRNWTSAARVRHQAGHHIGGQRPRRYS